MTDNEKDKIKESVKLLLAMPYVKTDQRTPTKKELEERYKLSRVDGKSDIKVLD